MKHAVRLILFVISSVVLVLLAGWFWVLLAANPLAVPGAAYLPWPVVCSTRGCVTTRAWQRQHAAMIAFADAGKLPRPTPAESLTTIVRQHLAHYGQLASPITDDAAVRYRQEILNATDEGEIRAMTGFTLADYDKFVTKPFLEQESLRQQRRAESAEDLYRQLAGERWVAALPWHLTWDTQTAKVIQK